MIYIKNMATILSELIDVKAAIYTPLLSYFKKLYSNVEKSMPEPEIESSELYFACGDDFEHVLNFVSDDEICE